ncbi:hypothetical protein SAMN05216321_101128 [Cupriavidus sp. OV038]|jgi:hypothetical protein|uniref:hypothetical protein n=1 Tax=unclassified Cupriavidus TaxID=2640874 RepID=UPI0008F3E9E0|nr:MULTISPECIES: hypothetical protein [unclassified Cupriavidus]SFB68741.1 hypothetical protein SAMN05216321_101128 [Cupriavidus sp. OV038]SFO58103.1 hypothetical protein SAMN05216322_101128 [Cupriavidus sp. OV096]
MSEVEHPMDAIFQYTEQALHVSFLILSQPAMADGQMRRALIRAMEGVSHLTGRQQSWLQQLRGEPGAGRIDFGDLDMLEVRGQCAMIVAAVRDRLPRPERGAMLARYGVGDEKTEGVRILAGYARVICGIHAYEPVLHLIARHYAPRKTKCDGMSVRDIGDRWGVNRGKVQRAAKWMATHFVALEARAVERLGATFREHGVVSTEAEREWEVERARSAAARAVTLPAQLPRSAAPAHA